jgi:hypothetical protein
MVAPFVDSFRTEFREEFRLWRHLVIPAVATLLLLFPRGDPADACLHTDGSTAFMALGWLCIGAIAAGFLRTRRTAAFGKLGRVFMPGEAERQEPTPGLSGAAG